MSSDFYKIAEELDVIKIVDIPTEDQIKRVLSIIEDEKFARYFFIELNNPFWVPILFQNGFFGKVPEPIEIQPGSFQIPEWPIGSYLSKFANFREEITAEVIRSTQTRNWRVQEALIDALMRISSVKAAELIPIIDSWLESPFSDMLPNKLVFLTKHMAASDQIEATVNVFQYITKPTLKFNKQDFSKFHSPLRFRSDRYWVNEYYQRIFPLLNKTYSKELVTLFEHQIFLAIELTKRITDEDAENLVGFQWRRDILFRYSNRSDAEVIDLLVEGLRDSLIHLCQKKIGVGRKILYRYLSEEHLLQKRIAIYALRSCGTFYPELVERELSKIENLEDQIFDDDYRGLMRDQFGTISPDLRHKITQFILSGPSNVEEKARSWASVENREPTTEDAQRVIDRWRFQHLPLIKEYLSHEEITILDAIIKKYGQEPDIRERPSIEVGTVRTASSPIPTDQLEEMDFSKLKELFVSYEPKNDFLINRDSLGREFHTIVSNNSAKYLEFAPHLMDDQVRFVYTYYFLRGITEGIKKSEIEITSHILKLCLFVVNTPTEPHDLSREPHEPGLDAVKGQVADLLDEVVKKDDYSPSREHLNSIREMLISLVHHTDPSEEKEKESSMDPFTYSLNCIRGKTMHGIFDYSLFIIRQKANQEGKERIPGFIEEPIVEILNEKLNLNIEKSPAVRSVFGAYLTQLHYLSKKWVVDHLDQLFPSSPELETYWRAAWDGYIFGSNVIDEVYKLLIPQYKRGLRLLGQPGGVKEYFGGSPNERLAQQIMVIYLRGLTDFKHENQILDLFFDNAPDQIRAQAIFWLSKVLANEKPKVKSDLWQKCWNLWQNRLEKAETEEVLKNGQEISDYMRWLVSTPLSLDLLFEILQKSIKYFQDSYDVMQLSEYVEKYSGHFPLEAISLLYQSVTTAKEPWWRASEEVERKIIISAMTSKNPQAREIAIDLINFHGEQGDYRWKDLLDL